MTKIEFTSSLKVNLDKPLPTSGYTPCACRDCFDVSISSDVRRPELCQPCRDAGCMPVIAYRDGDNLSDRECQRDDAYGTDLENDAHFDALYGECAEPGCCR